MLRAPSTTPATPAGPLRAKLADVKAALKWASLATEVSKGVTLRPPIRPHSIDKRQDPVAHYQWNPLKREQPGIILIKRASRQ
jgi:hypothetical protein